MRRWLNLLLKELNQHKFSIGALVLSLAVFAAILWFVEADDPLTPMRIAAASRVTLLYAPFAAFILGRRLVVREYYAKTQLFLEALPIRRFEVVCVKFGFGLFVLNVPLLALLLLLSWAAGEHELRFIGMMSARAFGFALAAWSLFFALGLMGRLRIPIAIALTLLLYTLDALSTLDLSRFGPFALIDETQFAYERELWPSRALAETFGVSAALLAIALALALIREGSVAEALARRASAREKSAATVFLVLSVFALSAVEEEKPIEAVDFSSSEVVRSRHSDIAIMYGFPELKSKAKRLLFHIEKLNTLLRTQLSIAEPLSIRLAHQSSLEENELREQSSGRATRLMLKVNLGVQDLDAAEVLQNIAHHNFARISDGRAATEARHWFLDGFSLWCAASAVPGADQRYWVLAQHAARRIRIRPESIASWDRRMEQLGASSSNALAFSGIATLEGRHGRSKLLRLARKLLATPQQSTVFGWLGEKPFATSFEAVTGESWPQFVSAWQAKMQQRARSRKARALPRTAQCKLSLTTTTTGSNLEYGLSGAASSADRQCVLLHHKLPPYDVPSNTQGGDREPFHWPAATPKISHSLRGRYQPGERVFAAIDCKAAELNSWLRLCSRRLEAP